MLCVLTLVSFGYFALPEGLYAYRVCTYSCGQRLVLPDNEACTFVYGEA